MRRWIAAGALLAACFTPGCGHNTEIAGASSTTDPAHVVPAGSTLSREKRKREDASPDDVTQAMKGPTTGGKATTTDSSSY